MWVRAPVPARRTRTRGRTRTRRAHQRLRGRAAQKGCAPSPLQAPHASGSVLLWLCTAPPFPPCAPRMRSDSPLTRRAHQRLRGRAAQRGAHQAHSKPRTPHGRSYLGCARRNRSRHAHPECAPTAPLPARRTPRLLRPHPYPPGAPEVTGASGAKGCAPSPARLRAGPALTVQGAPVPAMRTTRSLRVHPYPPGAPEVTGANGAKGCAPSPLQAPHASAPVLP
ncbi:hypothetical protein ABIE37_002611 [Arthrobacter bambusae]|uniref:Uncharacterized protein n=1 Tax=Arthrobacter bambusae TaxID=1338426 RepID=A0ABV2P7U7_9MICC